MKQKLGNKERQKSQASSQALDNLLKNELNLVRFELLCTP